MYVVVVGGFTVIDDEVAPVFQRCDVPPLTERVVLLPAQIVVLPLVLVVMGCPIEIVIVSDQGLKYPPTESTLTLNEPATEVVMVRVVSPVFHW